MKKLYILVNEDLKIGKGKFSGQSSHCCWTFCYRGEQTIEDINKLSKENNIEYIKCSQEMMEKIEETGNYIVIRDKGLTQLAPNSLTCISLGLMNEEEKDSLMKQFNDGIFESTNGERYKKSLEESKNLAMYIIVNNDITLSKDALAKYVSNTMFKLHLQNRYTEELIKDYMIAQKKIVLKCSREDIEKAIDEKAIVVRKNEFTYEDDNEIVCVNIGIWNKEEVSDFVKSLKLYSK